MAERAVDEREQSSTDSGEWIRAAVARYERPLARYAAHLLAGDLDRAKDLVQEAFLRLCDQDRAKVETHVAEWLYTVCRNQAIDIKRKERRMQLLKESQADHFVTDDPPPGEAVEQEDSLSVVLRMMEDLPRNQQEVIRLKFQHDLSYKQIGQILNLTTTNVGFLIHTGLKTLRQRMSEGQPAVEG